MRYHGGAGIGTGLYGIGGTIEILGGRITATGGKQTGAGIGGGAGGSVDTITAPVCFPPVAVILPI